MHQDVSTDPGWEGVNNRVECEDCPTVTQDFGWTPSNYCQSGPGELGGTVWQSRTPAWCGMALGCPLTFRDGFSVSGKIAVLPVETPGSAYIGFFNSTRQEWRPWSSMAIRLSYEGNNRATFGIDYMTGLWNAGGFETDIIIPADGKPHTWRFTYDPDATPPKEWSDPRLRSYLSHDRQTAEQIFEKAKGVEPDVTLEQIERRLQEALALGLVTHLRRSGGHFYTLNGNYENIQGAITLQVDDGMPYKAWLPIAHRDAPVLMDRFGIFNMQIYHRAARFYISDLTVNGVRIDLSRDPGWDGLGNRIQFVERDFQRQDFGYSYTNWAGKGIGEIGGLFYRTEPVDPLHGYYADDVGRLTLENPLSFSGSICFVNGGTDAGMFFGYFNAKEQMKEITDERAGFPLNDMLGIVVDGPSRIGYYFTALCSPKREVASKKDGPVFLPTRDRHTFSVNHDPKANNGVGRITVTLDNETFTLDLKPEQRRAGATFSISMTRLTRLADRRIPNLSTTQPIITVPYPPGGRKY